MTQSVQAVAGGISTASVVGTMTGGRRDPEAARDQEFMAQQGVGSA